jgi:hypothetical protein
MPQARRSAAFALVADFRISDVVIVWSLDLVIWSFVLASEAGTAKQA